MSRPGERLMATADRLYAERFERAPALDPWRARWCRLETLHAAALACDCLRAACRLADARYETELSYLAAVNRRTYRDGSVVS